MSDILLLCKYYYFVVSQLLFSSVSVWMSVCLFVCLSDDILPLLLVEYPTSATYWYYKTRPIPISLFNNYNNLLEV